MQGIFQKENTDKALKYGIYRHLPTYEKIIRNLVSFYNEKAGEKVAFLQIKNYCIEAFENGKAEMSDGAYQHVALDVEDIESMYQKICNEKYTVITDGIEELPFWENGVKFFMIKGPNEERIEFCQKL